MWGSESNGMADELRLKSSPPTEEDGNGTYVNLRAHGGSLDFENTKVRWLAPIPGLRRRRPDRTRARQT